jgi:hypothetical protein
MEIANKSFLLRRMINSRKIWKKRKLRMKKNIFKIGITRSYSEK